MALDGVSARRMIAAAEQAGRIFMCAQVLRFFPEYAALKNAMSGLGAVRGAFFRRRCAAPAWGGWLKDPAKSGGGVFDLLIHDVDMCLHLFGRPEAASAIGYCDTAASLDMLHGELFYPFGTVVVSGGWQHEGTFPIRHGIQRHARWGNRRIQFGRPAAHGVQPDGTGAAVGE